MSSEERTGRRSLVYSRWHRPSRVREFLGPVKAARLAMIDVDSCEYCAVCGEPVALIEHHRGTTPKKAPVTALLAKLAGLDAYCVAYTLAAEPESCGSCGQETGTPDIEAFAVRRIQPADPWVTPMSPHEYAQFLLDLRRGHLCVLAKGA